MTELYSAVAPFAMLPKSLFCEHITMNRMLTSILQVTIELIVTTMESYRDASNPRIPRVLRIDRAAARGDHCAGPDLVGCCAHPFLREVALRDCGRAIGGAHRLVGCRPVSRCGEYVFRGQRHRGAV